MMRLVNILAMAGAVAAINLTSEGDGKGKQIAMEVHDMMDSNDNDILTTKEL